MPITRSLKKRSDGTYRITLPKSWVENAEKILGRTLEEVYLEVDNVIVVSPTLEMIKSKEVN